MNRLTHAVQITTHRTTKCLYCIYPKSPDFNRWHRCRLKLLNWNSEAAGQIPLSIRIFLNSSILVNIMKSYSRMIEEESWNKFQKTKHNLWYLKLRQQKKIKIDEAPLHYCNIISNETLFEECVKISPESFKYFLTVIDAKQEGPRKISQGQCSKFVFFSQPAATQSALTASLNKT